MAFCSNCGIQLEAGAKFCGGCGTPAPAAATPTPVAPVAATPAPAPAQSKVKRIVLILLIPIIAIAAGIAGVAGYLYIPGLLKAKTESHVFLQTTATVTANTTSLYAEQSAKSTVLKTLKKDDVIIVTGLPANGWAPVKSGNISGWVLLNSITVKR